MITGNDFLEQCNEFGFKFFTGTPCSYLKPLINSVIESDIVNFLPSTNEGDAVGIASGVSLAGEKAVVIFQNSGLGNAVNPLTSLSYTFQVPFLGIVTLRGEPGGTSDEPQHELMGQITTKLLETMQVKWAYFPREKTEISKAIQEADYFMTKSKMPFFFVMRKGDVEARPLTKDQESPEVKTPFQYLVKEKLQGVTSRTDALKVLSELYKDLPIIATTGKSGRELFEIGDYSNQIYMVGSMGCAPVLGLGISEVKKDKPVCVIDGDGALMMRLGTMCTLGLKSKGKLFHVLLDNGVHDSTGGQATYSSGINFAEIAKATGYQNILATDDSYEFEDFVKSNMNKPELSFVHFKIKSGSPKNLGRPTLKPFEVAKRFKSFLKGL
ncbi:MAG: phosphonopyruvate decarboxylase [Bacteriovoracaceae bacterium]|jgi:phosphonopyruvate decarboxylase|nr:phosphonopyruvate decarboxylase [Bacteriovoracaceae bacterium]